MRLIPASPYKTLSKAESRVFDRLGESFTDDDGFIAFHSLNLTGHRTKKFGEADFVIVCKFGVFVLEVKGGRVRGEDGFWYTVDGNDQEYKIQNPFRQAETALHAIKNKIAASDSFSQLKIPTGYGVIFPDVRWSHQGSEWDMCMVCDLKNMRNFESWLVAFFDFWQERPGNHHRLSSKTIGALKQFLRPDFETVEPLYSTLLNLEQTTVELTREQYRFLDVVAANPRVLCSGGAGTGKTFLAAELVRRLAWADKKVVFVCKSNWLKRYLETKIINEFMVICTIDALSLETKRAGVDRYDILIVDEGQDLFNLDDMARLNTMLKGGFSQGQWYIFHDINNQAGFFSKPAAKVLEMLNNCKPARVPLTRNCRNSAPIIKKVQDTLGLDMGTLGTGHGPQVMEVAANKTTGYSNALEGMIEELLEIGVPPGSITILSPFSYHESSVSSLSCHGKKHIVRLDDYSVRAFPPPFISFARIKDFKGLENDAVIVIDLEKPDFSHDGFNMNNLYVAMSRARGLLCIIWK
ncbi:MAG: NERD domain-containing protein [Desulfobacterium sp.]|jgi:hypothetical protein|nr:NERD domain-containing protein [Desulfobacterium sp.]